MSTLVLAFIVAWILGAVLSGMLWRLGAQWKFHWRVLSATTVAAIFFAPSLIVGHGAAPFPLLGTLAYHSNDLLADPGFFYKITAIPLASTRILCLIVFFVLGLRGRRDNTA